eukprot:gene16702-19047_t
MFAPISHSRRRACDNSNRGPKIGGALAENPFISILNSSRLTVAANKNGGQEKGNFSKGIVKPSVIAAAPRTKFQVAKSRSIPEVFQTAAPITKFGAIAANEGSGVLVASLGLPAVSAEFYATVLGTVLTVVWKVLLMPPETCKTVLQVDGTRGFEKLMLRVTKGNVWTLWQGSAAAILATTASHYPWFYTYNLLDRSLHKTDAMVQVVTRSAFIGFVASAVSDTVSNFLRILKTVKQSTSADGLHALSYLQITKNVYAEGGLTALLGRGLGTRIITNGIQSILFTVLWKVLPLLWKKSNNETVVVQ